MPRFDSKYFDLEKYTVRLREFSIQLKLFRNLFTRSPDLHKLNSWHSHRCSLMYAWRYKIKSYRQGMEVFIMASPTPRCVSLRQTICFMFTVMSFSSSVQLLSLKISIRVCHNYSSQKLGSKFSRRELGPISWRKKLNHMNSLRVQKS